MKNDELKFTNEYSKKIPIVTGIIFFFCLMVSFVTPMTSVIDASIGVAAITISGSIFGTSVVAALKKFSLENAYILKLEMFKQSSRERLKYNESMLKLMKKYNVTKEDVGEIEEDSFMDEMNDETLDSLQNLVNTSIENNSEEIELQSFN